VGRPGEWRPVSALPTASERPATNQLRAEAVARYELERLLASNPAMAEYVDSPETAVHGHAPGYGPDAVAQQLETYFGTLEDQPSWPNSRVFADAAAAYGRGMPGDQGRRHSQFLMSPERYSYMQDGPGRTVDLLRGLRDDPDKAMFFWDKSRNSKITRDDYGDPLMTGAGASYARYSGFAPGSQELLTSPLSPIGRYAGIQNIIPSTIKNETRGNSIGVANAANLAAQRYRLGENPIVDEPDRLTGETDVQRADRLARRLAQVQADVRAMAPPTPEELARNKFGAKAPAVLGYLYDFATGLADATAPGAAYSGVRAIPGKALTNATVHAAARSTGLPRGGIQAMMARGARSMPDASPLQLGAKVAAYRGVPASAYASQLRPPSLSRALAVGGRDVVAGEMAPEMALEGAVQAALPQANRTWWQFLFSPATTEGEAEYAQLQKERAEAAERAATRTEVQSWQNPNPIWHDFQRAQGQLEVPSWAQGAMRAAPDSLRRKVAR